MTFFDENKPAGDAGFSCLAEALLSSVASELVELLVLAGDSSDTVPSSLGCCRLASRNVHLNRASVEDRIMRLSYPSSSVQVFV